MMKFLFLPFFLCLIAACSDPKGEAETVVRRYDAALIKAFASGSTAPLKDIAGEKEFRKIGTLVEYKGIAGVVLESQLLGLSVDSFSKTGDDEMTASTTERWKYFDRPLKPGGAPGKTIDSEMKLKYFLKREGGVWKVEKVEGISHKTLNETK